MKRFLPIRVFSTYFAYGYWWGEKVYFIPHKATCFAVIPVSYICSSLTYETNNMIVGHGDAKSWSKDRQWQNRKEK